MNKSLHEQMEEAAIENPDMPLAEFIDKINPKTKRQLFEEEILEQIYASFENLDCHTFENNVKYLKEGIMQAYDNVTKGKKS